MRAITTIGFTFLISAFLAAPAAAEENPYAMADNAWISMSGEVESVDPDEFVLDYGDGSVIVEMDDGDRDADAYKLMKGDDVTVSGLVDDDFFETTTIEASSVYVDKLGTYFYASAVDEEDDFVTVHTPVIMSETIVQGTVKEVNDEEFVVDTGFHELTVEVEEMAYNPLDDQGYQKVEAGDVVSVTGDMDDDFFEGRELVADTVTVLTNGPS
jgi:uncharacterized protein YdeI (BOF family)